MSGPNIPDASALELLEDVVLPAIAAFVDAIEILASATLAQTDKPAARLDADGPQ